ncbi:V/A-type H+-transporting ATPase subunit A [Rhodococcus sp. AG1013]|nr:V/A-type H+-transporting ATPase subunit A [Rhodococcus sp. AG1013]
MTARVVRVSGSLVEVEQLPAVAIFDIVALGARRLPGEVVAIDDGLVTVQAYEDTAGLAPGAPAESSGAPLSARLGPGLLGGVFDGLLRPLSDAGTWLSPGASGDSADEHCWEFTPTTRVGVHAQSGDELGVVTTGGPLTVPILVPPTLDGIVDSVAAPGRYRAEAVIASVSGTAVPLSERWPVRRPRPSRTRIDDVEVLHTGQRVLDMLFPIARGSTAAVPGGFGTGKTMLLQQIAKWCDADVIVYVGCGERGNEMADVVQDLASLTDPRTGHPLAARTVVIANTSNMALMARESSIYSGVTVAEYFRDLGHHVVVIADSTSRWAEALREFASRSGELPAEEGYPADLASALAAFYERSGQVVTLGGRRGSVTIVGAVSPSGGDMSEPVTAQTLRFVRAVWSLDRDLAYARHYPAVAWSGSFSTDTAAIAARRARDGDPGWTRRRARISSLLADADRLDALAELVGRHSMPAAERVVMLGGRLLREGVLQQSALSDNDGFCSAAKGAALADAVLAVIDRCTSLVDAGVEADALEAVDFGPLVQAREEAGPDDLDRVERIRDDMLARLEELS